LKYKRKSQAGAVGYPKTYLSGAITLMATGCTSLQGAFYVAGLALEGNTFEMISNSLLGNNFSFVISLTHCCKAER